jgi:hypothetical protein
MMTQSLTKNWVLTLAVAVAVGLPLVAVAKTVSGKVVSVSHQKVTVNNVVLDKVEVTVDSCAPNTGLVTVNYSPATVSEVTALGHLFDQKIMSARTPNMPQQAMINGYGVFWTDDTNRVLRTGILGHGVDCAKAAELVKQFP